MKIIKSFKMFEGEDHYTSTSWTRDIDGVETTVTIGELEKYLEEKNVPVIELEVDKIFHLCAHKDKKDEKTLARIEEANLDYPIIVSRDLSGKYNRILDGMHRVLKAHNHKIMKIRAKVLDLKTSPKKYQIMFS